MIRNLFILILLFLTFDGLSQNTSDEVYFPENPTSSYSTVDESRASHTILIEKADEYFNLSSYDEAIHLYDKVIQESPYNELAYFGRANCRERLGNVEGALADYRIVHHLAPEMSEAFFNCALLEFNTGDFKAAIPLFEKLLTLKQGPTQAIYFQGVQYSQNATPSLTGISSMAGDREKLVYHYLGKCYEGLMDYEQAEIYYTKALSIQPSAGIYLNRGILRNKFNFNKSAIEDFQQALALEPQNSLALYWLSIVAQETGDDSLTIAALDKVIMGDHVFPEAFIHRGFLKYKAGDYKGAIRDYTNAINLTPSLAEAFIKRGLAKEKLSDYKGAIKDFNSAIKLDKNNSAAFEYRGNTYFKQKNYEAAVRDYNYSIKLDQENPTLYYNRALARNNIDQIKGGSEVCVDLQKAIELGMELANTTLKSLCK